MHLCVPFTAKSQFEQIALSYIERFKPALTIVNSTVIPGTTRTIRATLRAPGGVQSGAGQTRQDGSGPAALQEIRGRLRTRNRAPRGRALSTGWLADPSPGPTRNSGIGEAFGDYLFGVLIAFAQEINRYAATVDGNYDEAVSFFEEVDFLPRTRYFPGFIGGHCVIPNINLLQRIAHSPLLEAVLDSNCRRTEELRHDNGVTRPQREVLNLPPAMCLLIADTRHDRFPLVAAQWAALRSLKCWRMDICRGRTLRTPTSDQRSVRPCRSLPWPRSDQAELSPLKASVSQGATLYVAAVSNRLKMIVPFTMGACGVIHGRGTDAYRLADHALLPKCSETKWLTRRRNYPPRSWRIRRPDRWRPRASGSASCPLSSPCRGEPES